MTRTHCAWALALAALAGCANLSLGSRVRWERSGEEPPRDRTLATLRWRVPLVTVSDLDARSRSRAAPLYDPATGVVFAGALDRGVYALRATDGAVLWRFQTLGPVEGTPTLDRGVVYVGSGDGALYALDAATGRMRWRFATAAEIVHAPLVRGDSVYFVNADDTVFSVSRDAGESLWRYRREAPGGITGGGHAGLLLRGNRIYTGFSDGRVVALDVADGTPAWERDTSVDSEAGEGANEAHRTIDVDTTPVLVDGNLFAASYTAGLYALDPEGGGVRWRIERLANISTLTEDGHSLYATSATLGLMKIAPGDGEVIWMRDLGSRSMAQPLVANGLLFVPSGDMALWVLRTDDGEPLGGLVREGVSGAPFVTRSHVFFETNRGVLYDWQFLRQNL